MRIYQVDAFAHRPFRGNPAAVCLLDAPATVAWMQDVAAEMNLSETAFVHPEGDGVWGLRWFTPVCEVNLCGHATLASAHVLFEGGAPTARFRTASGELRCERVDRRIRMDFPAERAAEAAMPEGLAEALGTQPVACLRNRFDWLLILEDDAAVQALGPDTARLLAIEGRGFIVSAASSTSEFDFVSRFFCPAVGVAEDPVTGSAHCCLGPYWSERLRRRELSGYQASSRGGIVDVIVRGDRVDLLGEAITVMEGTLRA